MSVRKIFPYKWINILCHFCNKKPLQYSPDNCDMLPSYRTMKYKSPIWGYFHVQKE